MTDLIEDGEMTDMDVLRATSRMLEHCTDPVLSKYVTHEEIANGIERLQKARERKLSHEQMKRVA